MKIRQFLSPGILMLALASNSAHAGFFFFIPGSVTSKISDAITGSEGDNCVGQNAKVGDTIRLANGSTATVKSLSGTSSRCEQPEFPIRAHLVMTTSTTPANAIAFNSKAGIDLPDGWESVKLSDELKAKLYFFYATNRTIDAGLLMSAARRAGIKDMSEFAKTRRTSQMVALNDAHSSDVEQFQINGTQAWRFEVAGILKSNGKDITYLITLIDGGTEVVELKTWIYSAAFSGHKTELGTLAYNIVGLDAPPPVVNVAEKATVLPNQEALQNSPTLPSQNSIATRLRDLNKLRQDGLIADQDFEAKKKEILRDL